MIAVYTVTGRTGKPHFIGTAPLGVPFSTPRMVRTDRLIINAVVPTQHAADLHRATLMQQHAVPERTRYQRGRVRCTSTDEIYESAAVAASALKLSRALMSMHLNQPSRYPTVGGYVFERIAE